MELQIKVDRTGFPLIYAEPIDAYIHWLPFTKIQMEYFICSTTLPDYTEDWYFEVREYNERVSPGAVNTKNYWGALLTGVKPKEIRQMAAWLGNFDMPTQKQWIETYKFFKRVPYEANHIEQLIKAPNISKRAARLIGSLDYALRDIKTEFKGGRTLADQMLMRMGGMEYIYLDEQRMSYGGFGQPNPDFFGNLFNLDNEKHDRLNNPQEGTRMRHYGFRLVMKGAN